MEDEGTHSVEFDPLSRAFSEDPYRVYGKLRSLDEPFYFKEHDMWLLSRYDDVVSIATNPDMVRSLAGIESETEAAKRRRQTNWHDMPHHERFVQSSLLDSDGEIHRRLRKLVFGEFTTRSIAGLEPTVQGFVDDLLDTIEDREQIDFIEDFAAHIPGLVIGHLLGVPTEHARQLRLWSERVVQFFDVDRSDDRKEVAETATRDFYEFLVDLKVQRRKSPKPDLISKMIVDEDNGLYTEDEFISTCMLILMAGHGSTIDVLSTGMLTLLRHPVALERLRQKPEDIPKAIQEMFRFESPLPFFHRHALTETTILGRSFPAGTTFGLLYGAANRDPAQFPDPDTFDIDREPNRHLAFGQGAHLCLGNNLARLNMRVIFSTLLQQFSSIELAASKIDFKRGLSVRGVKNLQLRLMR